MPRAASAADELTAYDGLGAGRGILAALCISVFENEAPREIDARLRYRVKDGALTIWFELVRPHKVLEAAFRETWARIEQETQTPILLGAPE
jgi:hypothetical protein